MKNISKRIKFVKRAFEKLVEFELHSCALLRIATTQVLGQVVGNVLRAWQLYRQDTGLYSASVGVEVEASQVMSQTRVPPRVSEPQAEMQQEAAK
jgi:hypothetical protein